jgi:hypothetical protein
MSKRMILILALLMCTVLSAQAAPSNEGGPAFLEQGKFAIGIETFNRDSRESEIEYGGSTFKAERDTTTYAFEIGYMVIPALQLRLGYSLESRETKDEGSDDTNESSETSIKPGFRYYVQASPTLFPFGTVSYALTSEEDDDFDETMDGTEMSAGVGMLVALGGGQGGFAAASVEYVSSEETREGGQASVSGTFETTRTYAGLRTQLILGLYF